MSTSNFDPDVFLSIQVDKALDTRVTPVPEGVYPGVIDEVKPKIITGKETGIEYLLFEIFWLIDDPKVKEATGRDRVRSRQSVFIDRTPQGSLDISKGKNVQLGKLREAVHQNVSGQPWAPSMLIGAAARISVKHEKDKTTGDLYDQVVAATQL